MPLFGRPQQENPEIALHKESLMQNRSQIGLQAGMADDQIFYAQQEEREQLTRWQQDLSFEMDDFRHDLLNEVKTADGKWVPNTDLEYNPLTNQMEQMPMRPRLNKKGIAFVLSSIKRHINRNTMRCSLDVPTINRKMRIFGYDLCIALAVNYDVFGIDMTEYHLINTTIRNFVHFTMLRALNDGERKNEREIRRLIENFNERPNESKPKGMFNMSG